MSAPTVHLALIVLKATAILAAGALLAGVGRRAPARVLHALWTAVLAALLLLPALHLAVPARTPAWLRSPAVPEWTTPVPPYPHRSAVLAPPTAIAAPADHAPAARAPLPAPIGRVPWGALALAVWGCGAVLAFVRIAAGAWRRRIGEAASLVDDDECRERLARIAARLGMRTPRLRMVRDAVPATWGVLRPVVVLPVSARGWPGDRLDAVLHHELVHVRRRDALWCGVAECACALFWFHPGAWLARRAALRAQEQAADDLVLRTGAERLAYARALLETARLYAHPSADAAPAFFRGRSELAGRLRRLTVAAPVPTTGGRALTVLPLALVAAAGCIVPLRPASVTLPSAPEAVASRTAGRPAVESGADPSPEVPTPAAASTDAETPPSADAAPSVATTALSPNAPAVDKRMATDTSDYRRQLAAAGLREVSAPALQRLRNLGVTPAYVREMRDAGLRLQLPAEAVSLWVQGVTPAFVREVRGAGTPIDAPADAVELWIHKVPAAFIRELADAGVDVSRAGPVRVLHNQGVRPAYVRELASAGMPLRDPAQVLEMHIHKVPAEFVAALGATGLRGLTAREARRLHNFGVDPRNASQIRTVSGYDRALVRIPSLLSG